MSWISALYFVEGLPNAIVASLSVGYYKSMGMGNAEIAMLTSALYLPWVLKGFWGPLVDAYSKKRNWIIFCASIFFCCFAGLAAAQFCEHWVFLTASIFWLLGFASATYDIAADGFYMLALEPREQSLYVGVRNAFYRAAVLFGQGAMMIFAGKAKDLLGGMNAGWAVSFGICAIVAGAAVPLSAALMPRPKSDAPRENSTLREIFAGICAAFAEFFRKKHILAILAFVLLYRFAEAQLVRVVQPFFMDSLADGGLGMSAAQVGFLYGTLAPAALLGGGILGGFFISRRGLEKSLMPMAAAMNLPNAIYIFMAVFQPQNSALNAVLISAEQFGYGFGFSGYMVFLMWASGGKNRTSSYAICTSLMALGIVIPGYYSGAIQTAIGYVPFFSWIMASTAVSFAVAALARGLVKKSGGY